MNYTKMTDFEINFEVAKAQGYDTQVAQHFGLNGLSTVRTTEKHVDFCNSWADAGPIIEDSKLCLVYEDSKQFWSACFFDFDNKYKNKVGTTDKNPLRAAMVVFLMMQEKNDE